MTDGQIITAIIAALVSISGAGWAALRWAVTQITKAINDSTAGQKEAAAASAAAQVRVADAQREAAQITSDAMLLQAQAFATMSAKLDHTFQWIEQHTPVDEPYAPVPLPEPPSLESERRMRERYPVAPSDPGRTSPYHYTKRNRKP
jgi:hypothetical protein